MSYIECPQCAHRALSVATRCPRCGFAFPARPLQRPDAGRRRDWPSALLAGVIVIGALAVMVILRRPGATRPPVDRVPATSAQPPGAPGLPDAGRKGAKAGSPAGAERSHSVAPPAQGKPSPAGVTRYARTWTNVRDGRAQAAPSVRVLNPGEEVLVDSLQGGWYRVLADGRPVGYVHRSNLDANPPATRP